MSKVMTDKEEVKNIDKKKRNNRQELSESDNINCFKCWNAKHGENEECPASGKKCDYCKK